MRKLTGIIIGFAMLGLMQGVVTATPPPAPGPTDFPALMQRDLALLPGAHVGLAVVDADSGKVLDQYQATQYFHPASTTKLFTAIAAMQSLGGNASFATTLLANPATIKNGILEGDLTIKFTGDPSFTAQDLMNLLTVLQQTGIQKIQGNIFLDNTLFPSSLYPLGHFQEDAMWAYGLSASALNIGENAVIVQLGAQHGRVPMIQKVTPAVGVSIHSNLVWQTPAMVSLCTLRVTPGPGNRLTLNGCLPPELAGGSLKLAIPDPPAYAALLVRQDLQALGIQLSGQVVIRKTPDSADMVLAQHTSLPLTALLASMLQRSDNLYASAISKTMGLKRYDIGGDKAGAAATMNYLASYDLPFYILEDGSGASYSNLVTPLVMTTLLYHANQNPLLANFLNAALPVAGEKGALQSFASPSLKDNLKAKSGALTGVATLCGFMQVASGKKVIFSLLVDNSPASNAAVQTFQAKVLAGVYAAH